MSYPFYLKTWNNIINPKKIEGRKWLRTGINELEKKDIIEKQTEAKLFFFEKIYTNACQGWFFF
jgi:hypothetical protein